MARKTAKDYRKEYNDICKQRDAFEARIIKRAKELCKLYPDIVVAEDARKIHDTVTGDYVNIENLYTITALSLIEIVETELANKHPHKQMVINYSANKECISPNSPDGNHYYEKGSKYCSHCGFNKNYF